ncbi:PREDICTED: guanylate cyclase 32E [Vollenhovia emeryi]|uniref:guanylate cyclase 32E n=1 Tax=Vollenhovia emeryi TaxID=411798 RepID=UPI0005F533A2|nr:PREDICTED: guanylate cyclase 32E [Vollenhovia emeryi]
MLSTDSLNMLTSMERTCLLLIVLYILPNDKHVYAETFTLGYITGSKRRLDDFEYQRPGFRISGAITLAVEQVNAGELGRRGHNLEILVGETFGEEETSILVTAELWKKNISAYIGPQETCIHEGRMAAAFNIPMISYFCTHNETSNKKEFPTFVRTRPPDTQIVKSVVAVLLTFNWTKVTFLHMNSTVFEFNKMSTVATTILASFEAAGITVNYRRSWSEPYHVTHMENPFHEYVRQTYRDTRIYVILGHYYEHMGLLMALDEMNLLEKGEYWVVGIDIEQYDEKQPNKYLRGLWQKETNLSIVKAFRSYFSIVASAPINVKNFTRLVNKYRQKPPFNFTNPLENFGGIIQIVPETAYLYDAVRLYEKSLLWALDENRNPRDGREIIAKLCGINYKSAMGYSVYLDNNGDAEGNYTLIALDKQPTKGYGLYPIGHFIGKEQNLPKLRLIKEISWIGDHGPPVAEPYCGYSGKKCNSHTGEIVGGITGALLLIIAAVLFIIYRNWKYEQELDSLLWKISFKDIQIKEQKDETMRADETLAKCNPTSSTTQPMRTSQVSLSSNPDADFRYSTIYTPIGIYKGQIFSIKKIGKKSIEITREMKKELKMMRDLRHDNLNSFIGACTDPPNICIIVEYCARGSLKDILENENIKLDNMFMASLIGDIIRGMIYLHESVIKYHGSLSTTNCLVDSRWVVKLADFGLHEFKRDAECDPSKIMKKYHGLLYKAPELLRLAHFEKSTVQDFQKGDVYSFGIVLYEMQGRQGPFGVLGMELSAIEILRKVITRDSGRAPFRPPLDQLENTFDFVRNCLLDCWAEEAELRPDFRAIRQKLKPLQKGMKVNIFDNMMAMMEKYANNLEALVDERTDQLTEEKKKTDALLYEMLPRYVAEELKKGKKVEAENFDCVTIYFSDIVGFTSMSAESTPLQVVDFLNDLYTCFDSTIENYDVYKVETIGDAYMVVSGLPIKNGIQHAGEIASMSLCLLDAIKQFTIRHRPLDKLQLRIGIHSGPVCAGVVGLKMPRYCLFGDTVNTASRMESSGLPLKIHCSSESKQLLDQLGGFELVERGVTSMKGKGKHMTYWLIGEDPILRSKRSKGKISTQSDSKKTSMADPLVPRSSLKNKSLVRSTFMRCSSESPKRLRFASSDQLDQKGSRISQLQLIVDNSSCKTKIPCVLRSSCTGSWWRELSSSSSCPCVEKLYNQEIQSELEEIEDKLPDIKNVPLLRSNLIFGNESYLLHPRAKSIRFGISGIRQIISKSAPSSPKHSTVMLTGQKRIAHSNEEIDRWDTMTPLIYCPSGRLDSKI